MIYYDFQDLKLSALGFGSMRLPTKGTAFDAPIDEEEARRMVDYAISHGVNYFDTAYGYHGGESERVMGRILSQYPRDQFYLASKFPGYEIRSSWDAKAQFEEQLKKCGVEYFDFYMLHNVYEQNITTYFDERWSIPEYLIEEKKRGRIKHLGFSTHGLLDTMKKFMDRYGEYMEFCQVQINYLDWTLQDAKEKYAYLIEKNIPIWVMEPVRGGALAHFSPEIEQDLKEARPDESIAAWAFRFLQGLDVGVTLSGMTTMEQVVYNIKTYETENPLTQTELNLVERVKERLLDMLPCTACHYCCAGCPMGLDIPTLLAYYNDHKFQGGFVAPMAIDAMEPEKRPGACIACGKCTKVCPQNIDIPAAMKDFQRLLDETPSWR